MLTFTGLYTSISGAWEWDFWTNKQRFWFDSRDFGSLDGTHWESENHLVGFRQVRSRYFSYPKKATYPFKIHPGRLTWNLKITQLKRKIIFQTIIFRFHVNLPGCMFIQMGNNVSSLSFRQISYLQRQKENVIVGDLARMLGVHGKSQEVHVEGNPPRSKTRSQKSDYSSKYPSILDIWSSKTNIEAMKEC